MRRLTLTLAVLLIAVPTAAAKSFEAASVAGDLTYRSAAVGESSLLIGYIGRKTQIIGPRTLKGIACLDGAVLHNCVKLKRTRLNVKWTVLKPVKLMHQQAGAYTIRLRYASEVRNVFINGCGQVRVHGVGEFSADGAGHVVYERSDLPVVIELKP